MFQRTREKAMYYFWWNRIITFARVNKLRADVVIDIKGIPECNVLEITRTIN